jgi:hypothetical protein
LPQRHDDGRQQAERHDAPAKERDREWRNASGNPARQDHVGDLRGGDQQKAEQAQHFACSVGIRFFGRFAHVQSCARETTAAPT